MVAAMDTLGASCSVTLPGGETGRFYGPIEEGNAPPIDVFAGTALHMTANVALEGDYINLFCSGSLGIWFVSGMSFNSGAITFT